jgi:hypothetical protein
MRDGLRGWNLYNCNIHRESSLLKTPFAILKFCPRSGRGRWPHTLKNPCFFDPMPKFKRTISGAPKSLIGKIKSNNPRTATLDHSDQLRTMSSPMPSRAPTEAAAGCAAGTPSTRGTLTTAVTPVTVQRGSGAARMPFLAAKDVPPPAGGTSASAASSRRCSTIRHPRSLRPFGACPRPRCFLRV